MADLVYKGSERCKYVFLESERLVHLQEEYHQREVLQWGQWISVVYKHVEVWL